jgi:hypothetical protein
MYFATHHLDDLNDYSGGQYKTKSTRLEANRSVPPPTPQNSPAPIQQTPISSLTSQGYTNSNSFVEPKIPYGNQIKYNQYGNPAPQSYYQPTMQAPKYQFNPFQDQDYKQSSYQPTESYNGSSKQDYLLNELQNMWSAPKQKKRKDNHNTFQ